MPSSQYDLSFIAKFVNKLSTGMKTAGRDVSKFGKEVGEAGSVARMTGSTFSSLVGTAMKVGAVIGGATTGLGAIAIRTSMETDEAFGEIEASMNDVAEVTDKRVQQMKGVFQDLSMRIPVSVKEMAAGAVVALKEFGDIPNITNRVEQAVISAYGGGGTVEHAMMSAGQIMHSFKDMSDDAFEYIIKRLPVLSRQSNASFDQFTRAIGRAAPLFADIGGSMDEFLSSFAEMTKVVGGRSSIVGFQMASLMNSLAKYDDVKEIIKKVGWIEFLQGLNKYFKGSVEQSKKLREAVGARGLVGLLQLVDEGTIQKLRVWTDLLGDGAKIQEYNVETVKKLMEGIQEAGAQWRLMKNGLLVIGERIGFIAKEALKPWFKEANLGLIELAERLKKIETITELKGLAGEYVQSYIQRTAAGIIERLKMVPGALYQDIIKTPYQGWKAVLGEYLEFAPKRLRSETKEFLSTNRPLDIGKSINTIGDNIERGLGRIEQILLEMSQTSTQPSGYPNPQDIMPDMAGVLGGGY